MSVGNAAITYPRLVQALTELVENSQARQIILKISSYGGSAVGAIQTMDAIRDLQPTAAGNRLSRSSTITPVAADTSSRLSAATLSLQPARTSALSVC